MMKKILSAMLLLSMLAAFPLPAVAANNATISNTGNSDIDVNGEFTPAAAPATVVSVDVAWTDMKFTYHVGSKGQWNAATHTYENPISAGWDADEKATITVKNHSNTAVYAAFAFAADAGASGVKGAFTQNELLLASADDDAYRTTTSGTTAPAPTATTQFSIDSTSAAITAPRTLGTVTVGIKSVTTVHTPQELDDAMGALRYTGGVIQLAEDLVFGTEAGSSGLIGTNSSTGTATSPLILDLGGHTITGRFTVNQTSNVVIQNGTIQYEVRRDDLNVTLNLKKDVVCLLKNMTIKSTGVNRPAIFGQGSEVNVTLDNCTVTNNENGNTDATISGCQLTLKNTVTISGKLNSDSVHVSAGGTYSINGTTFTPTRDGTIAKSRVPDIFA